MKKQIHVPLRLASIPKETIWGGNRLKKFYGKTADFEKIAESWELTVRPDGENTVSDGEFKDFPLSAILGNTQTSVLGTSCFSYEQFPLLIKFIDAEDDLSVQVHPDNDYARLHENEYGKTEMWYIAEADEGAQLVLGLKDGCSVSEFAQSVENGTIEEKLNYVPVRKGDVFFIPPGTVHAIGKGILIAEIQQNSNVTYRVYDYNRTDRNGTPRQLHTKKALDVIRQRSPEEIHRMQFREVSDDPSLLCSSEYFRVNRYCGESKTFTVSEKSFAHLLVLHADRAILTWETGLSALAKGDSWFLPAGLGKITIEGSSDFLITTLP